MSEPFKSQALEANLEQTRYKDIFIPEEHQKFINLSAKYFGINKRAKECITEYHHPLSNHTFVIEELRKILMDDFWFYTRDDVPDDALLIPLEMMRSLLKPEVPKKLRLSIVNTLLEFVSSEDRRQKTEDRIIEAVFNILEDRFESNRDCYILASKYAIKYLDKLASDERYHDKVMHLVRTILKETYRYWRETTMVENWLDEKASLVELQEAETIKASIGQPYFDQLNADLEAADTWEKLSDMPVYDQIASRFTKSEETFPHFITKFHYVFYLLHLPGMESQRERLIWNMNKMLREAVDEMPQDQIVPFIDTIFDLAQELRKDYMSAVLDFQLTLGLKIIDIDQTEQKEIVNYFEKKLINFGFVTPGKVFVDEDWQLSVDENHIKNIRVWLELIEHSKFPMEKLLSSLIVNLKLGGIFLSDTDLFQREITKILNST